MINFILIRLIMITLISTKFNLNHDHFGFDNLYLFQFDYYCFNLDQFDLTLQKFNLNSNHFGFYHIHFSQFDHDYFDYDQFDHVCFNHNEFDMNPCLCTNFVS